MIQPAAGGFEKIRRREKVLQFGNGYKGFGAVHINLRGCKIALLGEARARLQRVVEIVHPRRHVSFCLRCVRGGAPLRGALASEMQQRMRALPEKPRHEKQPQNRNGDPRVCGKAIAPAAAMMMTMPVVAPSMMAPMRAAGRAFVFQGAPLSWRSILEQAAIIRAEEWRIGAQKARRAVASGT